MTVPGLNEDDDVVPRRRSLLHLIPALAMLAATSAPAAAAEPTGLLVRVCSGEPGEYVTMVLPIGDARGDAPGRHEKAPCHAACPAALRETRKAAG